MPDTPSPTPQELPEEIATAIEELAFAYYSHGLGVGDGTLHQIEPRRSAEAHSALTAAILSRLGEVESRREEAQGAPFGTGYSRAEPSGLGPEAEYPSRGDPPDWDLELRWFHACGTAPVEYKPLLTDLWRAYCDMEVRAEEAERRAQGTEARSAETERLGPKDDGPVAEGHAPALTAALARVERLEKALGTAQSALAMLTEPNEIRSTSVANAWAVAVDAELKCRQALSEAPSQGDH